MPKNQLIKVAEDFKIEISSQGRKDHILAVVKEGSVQLGFFPAVVKGH